MGTRALIGKRQGDKVRFIYNQSDGYVEHLGKTLQRIDKAENAKECELMEFIANRVGGEGYFYLWDNGDWWACLDEEGRWYLLRDCKDIKYLIDYYENFLMKKYGGA